ncbi:MAG: sporulation integral membrane protein YtvI [Clostridia bacterium]|nr:sporulation integral membrane protein YtvI [Clostridia bacterium]
MEQEAKKRFLINTAFTVTAGIIVYISGKFLFQYLFPFVVAAVIAWAVQRPAKHLSVHIRIKSGLCAAVLAGGAYVLAVAVLGFLLFRVARSAGGILRELPDFFSVIITKASALEEQLTALLEDISPEIAEQTGLILQEILEGARKSLGSFFSDTAATVAARTPNLIFSAIVTLVASCYIAKDFEGLAKFCRALCGKKRYLNVLKIKEIFTKSILRIIRGYLILSGITFLELAAAFLLLRVRYALILALLIAFVDLLPVFGTGTVLVPWGIVELILGKGFFGAALILLYLTVVLVRNFAEPKVIGRQIGINPLFTLLAMFAGLKLLGFWGLIVFPVVLIVTVKYYKAEMEKEALS